jgi:hypothetical protein
LGNKGNVDLEHDITMAGRRVNGDLKFHHLFGLTCRILGGANGGSRYFQMAYQMTFNPSCIWFEDVLWCRSDPLLVALARVGNALFRQFPCISTPYVRSVPSRTICPECRLERSRWRGGHRLSAKEPAAAAEVRLGHKEGDSCDPFTQEDLGRTPAA